MTKILNYAKNINRVSNDNLLINGNFDVWQRGSSFYAGGFTADRWHFQAESGEHKISRLAGNVGLPNSTNILRIQTLSSGCYPVLSQIVCSDTTIDLRGRDTTFSFYARKPAYDLTESVSNSWSGAVYGKVYYSTSFDSISEGYIPINNALSSGALDNNDWNLYQTSFTVPNNASTLVVEISSELELDENSILDIGQAKLEIGTIATPSAPSTYNVELNKCKEYFQKVEVVLKAGTGAGNKSRKFAINNPLPVRPRSQNPVISILKNNNNLVDNFNTFISNDIFLNVSAFSKHPHSELSLELLVDNEILYGKEPSTVSNLEITRSSGALNLSWNPATNLDTSIGYSVLYGTLPNQISDIATFSTSSGTISGVSDTSPYYLQIYATNSYGSSPLSQIFEVAPTYTVPSGVGSLTGIWNFDVSQISWDAPTDNGGSPVTGYRIDRSMYSDFAESVSSPVANETIYTLPSYVGNPPKLSYSSNKFSNELTSTGNYYFRVTPINLAGTGTQTTFTLSKTSPSAPINLSTSVGNESVVLSYLPPASNGGNIISLINVQRSTTSGFASYASSNHVANYQPITISSLINGTGYYFRARAYNDLGYGPFSELSYAVPNKPVTVPGVLTNLSASWVDDDTISLSWSAPLDDGGSPIINYTIYSSSGSNFASNLTTSITQNSITSLTLDVPITGNYSTFYFRGRSNNSIGSSNFSSSTSLNKQAPGSTTISSLGVWDTSLTVSWNKPISRGSAITGYNVSYSTSNTFSSNVTTLTTTANSLTISSLTNGTPYYVKVAAVNSVGTGLSQNTVVGIPYSPYSPPGAVFAHSLGPVSVPYYGNFNMVPVNISNMESYKKNVNTMFGNNITTSFSGGSIWGSNPYSSDSDVRTAAIHAGVLTPGQTGIVYIYMINGLSYYSGVTKNGISSSTKQAWNGSYYIAGSNVSCTGGYGPCNQTKDTRVVRLSWNPPTNNGGLPITGYEIQYAANNSFNSQLTSVFRPGNTNNNIQCIPLSGSDVFTRVRAYNATGIGPWSSTLNWFEGAPPLPPPTFSVSQNSTTSLALSWSPPSGPQGSGCDLPQNISYLLKYWNQSSPNAQTTVSYSGVTNSTVSIPGPGSYTFQLQTKNRWYYSNSNIKNINVSSANPPVLSWTFTTSTPCCSSALPNDLVSALKDNKNVTKSTFSSCAGSNGLAFIRADFGAIVNIKTITITPHFLYGAYYLNHALLEGSTDGSSWTTIQQFGVASFSNYIPKTINGDWNYKYIRLKSGNIGCIDLSEFYFS